MRCPNCTGMAYLLGRVNDLEWWKCRSCGLEFHVENEAQETPAWLTHVDEFVREEPDV
jgi:ribosomal protein L37AE/L43A